MFRCVLYSLLLSLSITPIIASAGVVVGGTRLIFDGSRKEASLSVRSNDKDKSPYLIQSFIDNNGPKGNTPSPDKLPFIVTPPLFRLEAGQENVLRIIRTGGALPEDRESVFWMNVKAIPANNPADSGKNVLRFSIKNRIKLFYRPPSLKKQPEKLFNDVTFSATGDTLTVHNPTGYYLTFYSLSAGGQSVDTTDVMVPPKGSARYHLSKMGVGPVKFQYINDYGSASDVLTVGVL
ncbi:P pilus assembly protein, chaperone PapD [Enterobacteriaceae bacterium bta3-1]|nr:P pilus assembly protein, chaperone PapD [Enterobacteriaceae bacterium bta3-1]